MIKKITFFIATYSSTGVPLAQIRLAKALYRKGHKIEFVIGHVPDNLSIPEIEGIRVINLNIQRTYKLLLPIISYIRKNQPDVIFTAEDHINAIVTLAAILTGSKAKLSASSRITPYRVYSNKLFTKKWALKYFSILLRKRIDALVCVSQDMVKEYETLLGPSNYQCIYNIIQDSDTQRRMSEPVNDLWFNDNSIPVVISAGTLSGRKGFADLILAMKIVTKHIPARLVILGEGHLRADLETLILDEGLADSVRLLGFKNNPLKYFRKSKVFVLSSYAEGLPNVLVEAMACGCTPVATDCPTGPSEVLKDGRYGYLIPMHKPKAMAAAIQKALEHPVPRGLLNEAIEPFTEERVLARHAEALKEDFLQPAVN
ncbi:MAG: glycosyltransferase [Spirochaetales bacterium]|jgi:glycosyltransferase involved in cell wall biosynthesis|nr:glycosyltransferase [Spirochaetales bacterium]